MNKYIFINSKDIKRLLHKKKHDSHTSQQKLTVDIIESSTETAKAVPQAKGSVRYNSVSGSSSSSGSKNPTLLSTISSVWKQKC